MNNVETMASYSTIPDMWTNLLRTALVFGYTQKIDRGSFEKENSRIQLRFCSGTILFPLEDMVPTVPIGVPAPTDLEHINTCVGVEHHRFMSEFSTQGFIGDT